MTDLAALGISALSPALIDRLAEKGNYISVFYLKQLGQSYVIVKHCVYIFFYIFCFYLVLIKLRQVKDKLL